ncbi:MAG: hypothetical protein KJ613_04345, partial [Nanoarchaeota archaeon]|nr:hypothetical protein [Nanoarchaeota archaeon]
MKSLILTIIASLIIMIVGCVGGGNPINTGITKDVKIIDLDNLPVIAYDSVSAIGMLGAYSLTLSPDGDFELNSMRTSALGESYVVSGRHFFTGYCRDCLRVNSVSLDDNENIVLNFAVKHPFEKGNPAELPSATNRLDLDVFDLALVIEPLDLTPITYTQINVDVYTDILYNADGYTLDLTGVVGKEIALPYKICYQNSENNRFVMGTNFQSFDVIFNNRSIFTFNLYLTMGYGVSADFWGRTYPVYFVPEFNRKAAWKINVTSLSPDETWEEMDKNTKRDITINIYDWNHGTVVANTYPDINNTDHISALSDIISVTVEVPGMTNELITAETDDTETNGWDDPLTYTASFANENGISKGFYTGLVKVTDSRIPGESVIGTEPDILIDVPDGNRIGYDIPEFATYQTFSVLIKGEHTGWTRTWGGLGDDAGTDVIVDELGNTYVTGYFSSLVDFDPGPDEEKRACLGMAHDVFLSKFDSKGVFLWVQTWGGPGGDMVYSAILSTSSDNIYITGHFAGTVDFDPGPGEDWYTSNGIIDVFLLKLDSNGDYQWAKTWGNSSIGTDEGRGVTIDNSNNVYITGDFYGTVDFDPGPDVVQYTASSSGKSDIFLSSFDSDGNFRWAR